MRAFFLLCTSLFLALSAFATDLSGRYEGVVTGKRPDGSPREQKIFVTLRQDGSKLFCSAGLDSFDEQIPSEDVSVDGDQVEFTIAWDGGIVFTLKWISGELNGTVQQRPGAPPISFDKASLKRVGDLTLSDLVPRLTWETGERSPLLLQVRKDLKEGRTEAMQEFWKTIGKSGTPLIEPMARSNGSFLVTFVWKGTPETRSVLVVWPGSFERPDDYFMSHVDGTEVWFKTLKVRRGARIYYQLSPNDPLEQRPEGKWLRKAQGDPFNPKRDEDDPKLPLEWVRSLLELPGALPQPWYVQGPNVSHYSMAERKIVSEHLKSERKVVVYTPPAYSKRNPPYPSVYLTDGEDPNGRVFATWTFENLVADGKIPPVVVIRIVNPNAKSRDELACSNPFFEYLNDELVPFIRKHYNTSTDPSKTMIGGYSLGGLAAAYAGLRHPETFGLVLSQSGSFWYEPTGAEDAEPNWLAREYVENKKLPLRFYMDAGTYELDGGDGRGVLATNRQLRDVLKAKGYEVHYQEFVGNHDTINWRGTLADGLIALLGTDR